MPSVGPELPPQLKRKRSNDDDETTTSPPRKIIAGPMLPPAKNADELALDSSDDDDFGPSAPKVASPKEAPTSSSRRVLGPAPPPAPLHERPPKPKDDSCSDSSDEDDYGPSLPPPPDYSAAAALSAQQEADLVRVAAAQESTKSQRAEWMLVPPTSGDWTSRVDPTKLKNRKFASGKSGAAPAKGKGEAGISAIWTETPDEKRRRLEDEVLGRKEVSTSLTREANGNRDVRGDREDEEKERRIREYNEKVRGKSLVEEWKEKKGAKEEEDDPSKRGFDREKDMALGGRVGHVQKREMLSKAADFGSRFQKGSYL